MSVSVQKHVESISKSNTNGCAALPFTHMSFPFEDFLVKEDLGLKWAQMTSKCILSESCFLFHYVYHAHRDNDTCVVHIRTFRQTNRAMYNLPWL